MGIAIERAAALFGDRVEDRLDILAIMHAGDLIDICAGRFVPLDLVELLGVQGIKHRFESRGTLGMVRARVVIEAC
jgi:hypothetical protein